MKLSICMMIKNEEKNLHRCLKSLQELRDNINSELIIVDTGSTDNSVKIAKEYTESVYFHPWNDDFSEMRNITINYAKGEWILIIDADEKIEDCAEIIKFFKSNESSRFNTAVLFIRNFAEVDSFKRSGLLKSPRLFKKDKDLKYVGAVHNQPQYKLPIIQLNTEIYHYGYISDDKELMEKKYKRTKTMLENILEKEPDNIYYTVQLSVSYSMHKEYLKALGVAKKAYEIMKSKDPMNEKYIYVYSHLVQDYMNNGYYEETEQYGKEALQIYPEHIDILYFVFRAQIILGKYEESLKYAERYFGLLDRIKNSFDIKDISNTYYTISRESEVYMNYVKALRSLKRNSEALDNVFKISDISQVEEDFGFIINLFIEELKIRKLKEFYDKVVKSTDYEFYFICKLDEKYFSLKEDEKKEFQKIFLDNDSYGKLNKIRALYDIDREECKIVLKSLSEDINYLRFGEGFSDVIYYMILMDINIESLMDAVTEEVLDIYLSSSLKKHKEFIESIKYSILTSTASSSYLKNKCIKILCRYICSTLEKDDIDFKKAVNKYIECGTKYLRDTYNEFIIEHEKINELKNRENIFFLYMLKASELYEKNPKKYILYLKRTINDVPEMSKIVQFLLDDYEKNINSSNDEMEQYMVQVKNTIKLLIDKTDLDEAEKIIREYEAIVKDDIEIVLLKSQISLKK